MTEFQELIKDAPKFDSMERGELVAYAYAMYAAGAKADAENAKLQELAHLVAEYVSVDQCEGCVTKRACNAGDLDMCWIRKAILEKLRELGVEAE